MPRDAARCHSRVPEWASAIRHAHWQAGSLSAFPGVSAPLYDQRMALRTHLLVNGHIFRGATEITPEQLGSLPLDDPDEWPDVTPTTTDPTFGAAAYWVVFQAHPAGRFTIRRQSIDAFWAEEVPD